MTLVDANVLIDLLTRDAKWLDWSRHYLNKARINGPSLINDLIYAEISIRFDQIERLDFFLDETSIGLRRMSQAALFFAGKAFRRYRQSGGARSSLLPDFFIGAQAHVEGLRLLTRDPSRYRTYFPDIRLISPIT